MSSQTADKTILYLLGYNYTTHEQLSTYEPRIVAIRSDPNDSSDLFNVATDLSSDYFYSGTSNPQLNGNNGQSAIITRDIFTLAYLKSHSINITKVKNRLEASCQVSIMLPINDDHLNEKNYQLIQKYLYLKMSIAPSLLKGNNKHVGKRGLRSRMKRGSDQSPNGHQSHSRRIPTSFIEFELKEGPIFLFEDKSTSSLGIFDFI